MDCDLRKPVLHRYLKAGHNLKGVSNVLSRQVALSDALVELKDIPNLTFLPAGTTPPNPSELLSQPQMQEMVNTLRGSYDFVILDAPPISMVTDAAVIGRIVDGALFVVRSKYASTDAVKTALEKLQDAGVKVLGAVLTRYDAKNRSSARIMGTDITTIIVIIPMVPPRWHFRVSSQKERPDVKKAA